MMRIWNLRKPVNAVAIALLLGGCVTGRGGSASDIDPYDLVISGGRIVDGTGAAWFAGDVGVRGDRIARITPAGMLANAPARERVDARGHVVSPGFIDIQSHSRGAFLSGDGLVIGKVTQGVTTEIMGEGTTNAIINAIMSGEPETPAEIERLARYGGPRGFDNWLTDMEARGASVNLGSFLGGSNVRQYAMGLASGTPNAAQLDSMRKMVRWAMEGGAFGIATALIYPPASFATTEELIEASRAMAPFGGLYITHLRSEGDELLEAIDEAIRIGAMGGVPVEIYHLKAAGERNWPKIPLAIARIDSARVAGLDVQANMYPYIAAGTGLTSCFPPWASEDGKLYDNLADSATRVRIRAEIEQPVGSWENFCVLSQPENVLILSPRRPENRQWAGRRLSEIAAGQGKDWVDAAFDLVLSERSRVETIYFMMTEENLHMQLRAPWMKFGTDAGGFNPVGATSLVHPRAYGSFPRILGKYVREEQVIPLEDAIRKMSSAVATRLSLHDRGVLKEGMMADIVIFDPQTVTDRATFEQPHQLSVGVRDVFVNGVGVVRYGVHTGAKPGRAVRGPGYVPMR
jgi:N-acyl-D-amino-acid deacylase